MRIIPPSTPEDFQRQLQGVAPVISPNGAEPESIELVEVSADQFQEPLIIGVFGKQGSGKSRLAGTAPGKLGLLPLERKSRGTVLDTAAEFGVAVIAPKIDLVRNEAPEQLDLLPAVCLMPGKDEKPTAFQERMQAKARTITLNSAQPQCCQRHYFRWHVNRVKSTAYSMARHPAVRTIVIDTFGQLVEDVQYANYGTAGKLDASEFGFAPREDMHVEIKAFLNGIANKNLILIHHAKEEWKNNLPSGKMIPDNKWNKLGHFVSVMLEMERDDRAIGFNLMREQGIRTDPREPVWKATVRDCQKRPELIGRTILTDGDITFLQIAMEVYPNSRIENWE